MLLAKQTLELMHSKTEIEIENVRSGLNQQISVPRRPINQVISSMQNGRLFCSADKPNRITRPQLSELPQFVVNDHHGAYKSTETWTVGTEHDRHVAGKVHRADRISIVVQV